MKVQTDLKAGGLLNIVAVVLVDIDLFGGCGRKNDCGGGCK